MGFEARTDEELMLAVQAQGCRESFKVLYERHWLKIYNYIYYMISDKMTAEDCTHDAFIQLFHKAALYQSKDKFIRWLYRVARNIVLDDLRRKKVRKEVSLEHSLSVEEAPLKETLADKQISAGADLEWQDFRKKVHEGIAELKTDDRELILLCDIQGLSNPEAAAIMGLSVPRLTLKLFRARQRLAKKLQHLRRT